jgi:protein phosphatase
VWGDVPDRAAATEVRKAGELAAAEPALPDWLTDVARVEEELRDAEKAGEELDWLADVEIPVTPLGGPTAETATVEVLPEAMPAQEMMPPPVAATLPPATAAPGGLAVGGATSRGLVREKNEDHFLAQHLAWNDGEQTHQAALLVVADGLGAHQSGEKASSLAVRIVAAAMAPALAGILQGPAPEAGKTVLNRHLDRALHEAHAAVLRRSESDPACRGMGTTVAVAVLWDDVALFRHVGDCRAYLFRGDELRQLTTDHTLVHRMVELGQLTPEEASVHPARGELTQAVGTPCPFAPSHLELALAPGDLVVLASDGLGAHLEPDALRDALASWVGPPAELARRLVGLADIGGGSDNCTVVVAERG